MNRPTALPAASRPIDLMVLTLRNRGASLDEISRQTGLSPGETARSVRSVAVVFARRPEPAMPLRAARVPIRSGPASEEATAG